jgi:serine/threonine-protein kinase HipA
MLQWAFFNLIISNSDAHGKNISFFANQSGYHLTPYYDLVCIAMYPEFEQELSMAFGDDFSVDAKAYQIADMCEVCDINRRLASKELKKLSRKLIDAIDATEFEWITKDKKEEEFVQKLLGHISSRAKFYEEIADEIISVKL